MNFPDVQIDDSRSIVARSPVDITLRFASENVQVPIFLSSAVKLLDGQRAEALLAACEQDAERISELIVSAAADVAGIDRGADPATAQLTIVGTVDLMRRHAETLSAFRSAISDGRAELARQLA